MDRQSQKQLKKVENLIDTAVSIAKISNISKKEIEEMLNIYLFLLE